MNSSGDDTVERIAYPIINALSILACLLAAILVFALKLHQKVVYRLPLYQVLAALAFATVQMVQIKHSPVTGTGCIAIGWLVVYLEWMKLLFTMWVTVHVFCFAVLHRNLKKLEVLYVVTSLLVPAVIASVPLITHSYGSRGYCYIEAENDTHHETFIERFALWNGPAMAILLVSSTAMVVMTIKLAHRVCWKFKYEPITDGGQYWKALKQLLPLMAFPILFFIFTIPVFVYDIYSPFSINSGSNQLLQFVANVFVSMWSMSSGVTLIVHMSVVKAPVLCRIRPNNAQRSNSFQCPTVRLETEPISIGSTRNIPLYAWTNSLEQSTGNFINKVV